MKAFKSFILLIKLMKYAVKIEVSLKPGHSNPEGETITQLLKELGYQVEKIDMSKIYTIIIQSSSQTEAKIKAEEMCKRLLTNPTKDNYAISVVEQ
ncbi:MAG: phosphoribosylformylglycinamidine synthase subunit PurS [Candidatus Bathyarchaeota archaeon]|nr:phosphoribosylformylglycinamidine synthase subunit PurS [Candidatus Termiticorpusculum sp.]